MDFSSLNVDVLLHLMEFVDPEDRFNLAISGILRGFENVNKGIDLRERIKNCEVELGLRRGDTCELEIRSLMIERLPAGSSRHDESLFKILERLAGEGYLQNTQQFVGCESHFLQISSFVNIMCSMENLEKLTSHACHLTLEDLARVFQSCSKLSELDILVTDFEMDQDVKNQLRPGFQRLRRFFIVCFMDNFSWPVIQEMLTWLKECVWLAIINHNDGDGVANLSIDGSLTLDPNFVECLQVLKISNVPAVLVKWIHSVCFNIRALKIKFPEQANGLHNEIGRLKKLKILDISTNDSSGLKEIFRSCRQLEMLRMNISGSLTLGDLTELEPAEHITDFTLFWDIRPSIEDVIPILKKWRQLRRLTLWNYENISVPPLEVISDFIMAMEHLSYLHIAPDYDASNYDELEILRDKVDELILPRRPNFKFDISLNFV